MRVLVTGGAGYIGAVLCERLLAAGHKVTVLDTLLYGQRSLLHLCHRDGFSFLRGDVRDPHTMHPLLQWADAIVALAAIVGFPACEANRMAAVQVNRDAIHSLAFGKHPSQILLFPMTVSGYGAKPGVDRCTEETPLAPMTLYARTKVEAEQQLLRHENTISLRLATCFGTSPRMRWDLLVNDFVRRAVEDKILVLYQQHARRNYVHVRDVADAFAWVLEEPARLEAGTAYNLGLDEANMSKLDLATLIGRFVPDLYIHAAETEKDPDRRDYFVSSARLRAAGFLPQRTLEMGVKELLTAIGMTVLPHGRNA